MKIFINLVAVLVFGGTSYRVKWLSGSGSIAASLFGFSLLTWGGVPWVGPVLVFFGTSSLLSKIRRRAAPNSEDVRNAVQVLANGGVAWMMLAGFVLMTNFGSPNTLWFVGFAGALAAATADTWGTEIGRLSSGRAVSVLTGRRVPAGTSGGISWQGTLAGMLGAGLIAVVCRMGFPDAFTGVGDMAAITIAGVVGSLIDSLLGATLQVRYRDPETGDIIERRTSDAMKLHAGWPWMTNDTVNLACTIAGAVGAIWFSTLFA